MNTRKNKTVIFYIYEILGETNTFKEFSVKHAYAKQKLTVTAYISTPFQIFLYQTSYRSSC